METQKIYKYLSQKHADMMMKEGIIRIGTLYEYRKNEQPDKQRNDNNEGKMSYVYDIDAEINARDLPKIFADLVQEDVNFKNIILKTPLDAQNSYIYCGSQVFDKNLMTEFKTECCVEIFDIKNFVETIGKQLANEGYIYNCVLQGPCNYIGHEVDVNFNETAEFLKDKELYGHQAEYRVIYKPLIYNVHGEIVKAEIESLGNGITEFRTPKREDACAPVIYPIIISCNEIIKFCRKIS